MEFIVVIFLSLAIAFLFKLNLHFNYVLYAVVIIICLVTGVYIKYFSGHFVEYGYDGIKGISLNKDVKLYKSYEVGIFLEKDDSEQKWISDSIAIDYKDSELFFIRDNEIKKVNLISFEETYADNDQQINFERAATLINKVEWQFFITYLIIMCVIIMLFFVINGKARE